MFKINSSTSESSQASLKSLPPVSPPEKASSALLKIIAQSQTNPATKPQKDNKPEKPSLWKQLKTKARNLSHSTSAFMSQHPHMVKAAVTAAAAAVVAGVFFAASKSSAVKPSSLVPPKGGWSVESEPQYANPQPVPVKLDPKKQAILAAEPKPARLPAPGSKKFQFMLANVNSSPTAPTSKSEKIDGAVATKSPNIMQAIQAKIANAKPWEFPSREEARSCIELKFSDLKKLSRKDVMNFVLNHREPIATVVTGVALLLLGKKVSQWSKLEQSFSAGLVGGDVIPSVVAPSVSLSGPLSRGSQPLELPRKGLQDPSRPYNISPTPSPRSFPNPNITKNLGRPASLNLSPEALDVSLPEQSPRHSISSSSSLPSLSPVSLGRAKVRIDGNPSRDNSCSPSPTRLDKDLFTGLHLEVGPTDKDYYV